MIKGLFVHAKTLDGSLSCLYAGMDGDEAVRVMENPPADVVEAVLVRNPIPFRSRRFEVPTEVSPEEAISKTKKIIKRGKE